MDVLGAIYICNDASSASCIPYAKHCPHRDTALSLVPMDICRSRTSAFIQTSVWPVYALLAATTWTAQPASQTSTSAILWRKQNSQHHRNQCTLERGLHACGIPTQAWTNTTSADARKPWLGTAIQCCSRAIHTTYDWLQLRDGRRSCYGIVFSH